MSETGSVGTPAVWSRLGAYVIDGIFLGLMTFAISFVVTFIIVAVGGAESSAVIIANVISIIVAIWYFPWQEASENQGTWGKRILGIKVVGADGGRIGFGRAIGRYFAKILSAVILLIGFIMIFFTKDKQGLHDMIASTYVVQRT